MMQRRCIGAPRGGSFPDRSAVFRAKAERGQRRFQAVKLLRESAVNVAVPAVLRARIPIGPVADCRLRKVEGGNVKRET